MAAAGFPRISLDDGLDENACPAEGLGFLWISSDPVKTEEVGFEPTVPFGTPVFKTGAINHSPTPPGLQPIHDRLLTHDAMNLRAGRNGKPSEG